MGVLGSKLKITQIKQLSQTDLPHYATFPQLQKHLQTYNCHFCDVILTSIIQEYIIKSNKLVMSNSENSNPYLINRYGGSANRITRTNPSTTPNRQINPLKNQEKQSQQSKISSKQQKPNHFFSELLPKKVSDLSSNVIFQGMDKQTEQSKPQGPIKRYQRPPPQKLEPPPGPVINEKTSMGVLTNSFMQSTTKYQKGNINLHISTPSKGEGSQPKSPLHSQTSSQHGGIKFARKKVQQSKGETIELSVQSSPRKQKGQDTDSNIGSSKKIQRKPIGARQPLKKEPGPHQNNTQNNSHTSRDNPTNATELITELSEIKPAVSQRPYRPIQRQNQAESRSSVKIAQQDNTQFGTSSQIKKKYPARQSLQSQMIISKTMVDEQIAQNKSQPIQHKPYQNKNMPIDKGSEQIIPKKSQQVLQTEQLTPKVAFSRSNRYGGNKPQSNIQKQYIKKQEQKISKEANQIGSSKPGSRATTPIKSIQEAPSPISKRGTITSRKPSQINSLAESKATQNMNLKKSAVIIYILKRIFFCQLKSSFVAIRNQMKQKKIKLIAQALILGSSCVSIIKHKQSNLLKMAFNQLRKQLSASYISEIKPLLNIKIGNPTQSAFRFLHHLVHSKLRSTFNILNNKFVVNNKIKCLCEIQMSLKSKQHNLQNLSFQYIKQSAKNKMFLLTEFCHIIKKYNKQQLSRGFLLISSIRTISTAQQKKNQSTPKKGIRSLPQTKEVLQTPNTGFIDRTQKIQAINSSLTQNISNIEKKVDIMKKNHSEALSQLEQKISVLKEQNCQVQKQIINKRNHNEHMSKQIIKIATSKSQPQPIQDAFQPPSQKLNILTNIYIGSSKQQKFRREEIISEYSIETNDSNNLINEWGALRKNIELKKEIGRYEQVQQLQSKARKTVINEQQMVVRLVRSYIKQQYFWQWLHVSAESL